MDGWISRIVLCSQQYGGYCEWEVALVYINMNVISTSLWKNLWINSTCSMGLSGMIQILVSNLPVHPRDPDTHFCSAVSPWIQVPSLWCQNNSQGSVNTFMSYFMTAFPAAGLQSDWRSKNAGCIWVYLVFNYSVIFLFVLLYLHLPHTTFRGLFKCQAVQGQIDILDSCAVYYSEFIFIQLSIQYFIIFVYS